MLKKYVVSKHAPSAQILPFKTGVEQEPCRESFQARQLQGNALLDYGAQIQTLIQKNAEHRLAIHKLISNHLQQAVSQTIDDTRKRADTQMLQSLRRRSRDLGIEFVVLQKQFATLQSQFLQIAKSQRNSMLRPVVRTPVCTSTGINGVPWLPDFQQAKREIKLPEEKTFEADRHVDCFMSTCARRRMC